jgi:hypothetical protein
MEMRLNIINLIDNFNVFNYYLFPQLPSLENPKRFLNFTTCQDIFNNCQNYIIFEQQPTGSIKLFNYLLDQQEKGIIITRCHPEKLSQDLGLPRDGRIDMYWLSNENCDYVIHPWEIANLIKTLEKFIRKHNDGIILLNGLEYISTYNDPNKIMNLIFNMIELIGNTKAKILITIDPLALDNKFFFNIQNNSEVSLIPNFPLKEVLD